jgi:signal transduction histidine kinase
LFRTLTSSPFVYHCASSRLEALGVVDQGPGIAPEDREWVFQRFWRGKGVSPGGAGLGLAIVKEIMNAHRGRISVDAGPKGGAIFTLYFPLCPKTSHDLHKSAA